MEGIFEKVLDRGCREDVDVRKRKAPGCATYLLRGSHTMVPQLSKASSFKLNCKSKCSSCKCASRRHLYQSYLNLMRSRIPCRLMYFQNGEWVDLPSETLGLVRKDFELKKEAIEVNLNSHHLLLDFLHMIHLDVKTGLEQPLGWMDEAGSCFFPEFFTFEGVQYDCCQCYADKEEIKLQIDIKLNGAKETPSVEYNGESNPIIKILKVAQNHPSHHLEADVEDNCDRVSNPNIKNIEHSEKVLYMGIQSVDETLAYEEVMKMFGKGIHSAANGVDIADISRCSGSMVEARMELFQKQIEITKKHRGDANVRYAWLASSKEALLSVMAYGLGPLGLPNFKSFHDTGVPLAAADFSGTSAKICDDDENGIRYMILCRVIMGNMELINPGSKQFHPSSEDFDNGVDDLDNPQQYIVWSVNISTHICPEFVVSFRICQVQEGVMAGQQCPEFQSIINASASSVNMTSVNQSNLTCKGCKEKSIKLDITPARTTTCPRVSFSILFAAVANKISSDEMKVISAHHELYMTGKIPRVDFVRKLRRIVGDPLLWSVINTLEGKGPSENKDIPGG